MARGPHLPGCGTQPEARSLPAAPYGFWGILFCITWFGHSRITNVVVGFPLFFLKTTFTKHVRGHGYSFPSCLLLFSNPFALKTSLPSDAWKECRNWQWACRSARRNDVSKEATFRILGLTRVCGSSAVNFPHPADFRAVPGVHWAPNRCGLVQFTCLFTPLNPWRHRSWERGFIRAN